MFYFATKCHHRVRPTASYRWRYEHYRCVCVLLKRLFNRLCANEARAAALPYKTVPLSSHRFIGRLNYREKMKEYFDSKDDKPRRNKMFLLYGPGGMGKSEISIKYAEDHSDQ